MSTGSPVACASTGRSESGSTHDVATDTSTYAVSPGCGNAVCAPSVRAVSATGAADETAVDVLPISATPSTTAAATRPRTLDMCMGAPPGCTMSYWPR